MNRLQKLRHLVQTQGLGWAGYRVYHALLHKTGALERRLPAVAWDNLDPADLFNDPALADPERLAAHRAEQSVNFLFDPADRERYAPLLCGFDAEDDDPRAVIDQLGRGELSYFSNPPVRVGFPPAWHDNLLADKPGPKPVHFAKLDEFGFGDVKCIWEPNRFAFAYDLVRCYWRTGDERAPELFWQAAEDWAEHNPPNTGINWKCGQESTFRAMAWCFALWGLADSPATTPARVAIAVKLMAVTARRIEAHIRYALSQKNNHGVSEAMGLFTIGLLFPELRGAARGVEQGAKHLESQAQTLIYDDGAFSQHAANYHRVMLHDYLYAIRLGELNGRPLSEALRGRVFRAGRYLHDTLDPETGRVPRYGQDDGALILPLSNQPYDDYRPVLQACSSVLKVENLPSPHGPWDEEALWLAGPNALERGVLEGELVCGDLGNDLDTTGGCHVLRGERGLACIRAQRYTHHSPAQLDQLHVDLWWRGVNVALDPGTYSYNAEGRWAGIPLMQTAAHNTVMVDGREQAPRVTRFKYAPWPQADGQHLPGSPGGAVQAFEATSSAYRSAGVVEQTRWVFGLAGTHWLVIDRVLGKPTHNCRLHWNLADAEHAFDADTGKLDLTYPLEAYRVAVGGLGVEATADLVRADDDTTRGWYAPRYMQARPCLSLACKAAGPAVGFYSVFGPGSWTIDADNDRLILRTDTWTAALDFTQHAPRALTLSGSITDEWQGPKHD